MARRRPWLAIGLVALGAGGARAEPAEPAEAETIVEGLRLPRPVRDVPAVVTVLPREEIARRPSQRADDLLRTLPSVATFRRSSSLIADPSSQGLNLRGVGPSGVSRSLVLVDGVPENDPFGGWIYWRALALGDVDQIEVQPSGASAQFGNLALGGVVALATRPPRRRALEASLAAGSLATRRATLRATERRRAIGVVVDGGVLDSGGYAPIAPEARGAIDGPAPSTSGTLAARLTVDPTRDLELHAGGRLFGESLDAGTRYTSADVRAASLGVGARLARSPGTLRAELFGGASRFRQERARVAEDRATATRAARQRVPTDRIGALVSAAAAPWRGAGEHRLIAGVDGVRVTGESTDSPTAMAGDPDPVIARVAGGEQGFAGLFVEDAIELPAGLALTCAVRLDGWRNAGGHRRVERQSGEVTRTALPDRDGVELDPRVGLLARLGEVLAVRASGFRAFRAPTLNELYRSFQVGTVLTDANPELVPETLWGIEAGPELVLGGAVVRATGFVNWLSDPINNVTLDAPSPTGATRQRQNLGRARISGLELELGFRPTPAWTLAAGYTFVDPVVTAAPGHPQLVGKRLAQDPRQRATASLMWGAAGLGRATAQARFVGLQFEDDLNTLPLPAFVVLDAMLERPLVAGLAAFVVGENLLDRRYLVGRAGVDTIGAPRTVLVGLRYASDPR